MIKVILFGDQLTSDSLQFGFKSNSNCNHALFTLKTVVDEYVSGGSTVNFVLWTSAKRLIGLTIMHCYNS